MENTLPILEEFARELETVTDAEMANCIRRLSPVRRGEKKLGNIHTVAAHRAHALGIRYRKLEDAAQHRASFDATSNDEEEIAREEAARYHTLHELATALFWFQCRDDIGGSAWVQNEVGIREGFMLVVTKRSSGGPGGGGGGITGILEALRGGGGISFGLPSGLFGPAADEEDDEDKSR